MDWWIAQLHFLSYIVLLGATTLHTYIEVVHVWMFPSISSWVIAGAFLGLCYYIVTGGFRVVAGIGFFGIVIPSILIFTFFILCSMQISRIYFNCTAFIPRNYERNERKYV